MSFFVLKTWIQGKCFRNERGSSLVEYIFLVALIALLVIGAVIFMREQVVDRFNYTGSKISNTPNP